MNEITYSPKAGEHIETASRNAQRIAFEKGQRVGFQFNDVRLWAFPAGSSDIPAKFYSTVVERRHNAYLESPEGKAAQKRRDSEIAEKQFACDNVTNNLDSILAHNSSTGVLFFIEKFCKAANDIAVTIDHKRIIASLENAGFERNAYVMPSWALKLQKKFWPKFFENKNRLYKYIIGQVLSCLYNGMPPHQVTLHFIEKWNKLDGGTEPEIPAQPEELAKRRIL